MTNEEYEKYKRLYQPFSNEMLERYTTKKYKKPKWLQFCEYLQHKGIESEICFSKISVSKYVIFKHQKEYIKIRFSQHSPKRVRDFDINIGPNGLTYNNFIKLLEVNI